MSSPSSALPSPGRILVVDDEEVLRFAFRLTCQSMGHETHTASCASEALEVFQEARPDLVLLDFRMPDKNGLELARELRELRSDLRFALCSAHVDGGTLCDALGLGIVDFISKPVLPADLRRVIERFYQEADPEAPLSEKLLGHIRNHEPQKALEVARMMTENPESTEKGKVWLQVLPCLEKQISPGEKELGSLACQELLFHS